MSSTTASATSTTSGTPSASPTETGNSFYVPSSVISIGVGFVGFAAAFVIFGFSARVLFIRRNARLRGEAPPPLIDIFFAALGGSGAGREGRVHLYMNPERPWRRAEREVDHGPKPEIWDVKMNEAEEGEEEKRAARTQDWRPVSVTPRKTFSASWDPLLNTTNPSPPPYPVDVTLLIAMPVPPAQRQRPAADPDEDAFPEVCFGCARMTGVPAASSPAFSPPASGSSTPRPGETPLKGIDKGGEVQHLERVS